MSAQKHASDGHNDNNNDEKHFDDVSLADPPVCFEFIIYAAVWVFTA